MNNKEIPVLLLTGYLGSGKTTLVNHILSNGQGIKFAVIVNDLGEVNIDADLIQKGGVVDQKDDSLVALQNGCICCTLKMDLVEQLRDLAKMGKFDYIVIEASGICEPEPIARTICSIPSMSEEYTRYGTCRLDRIVTVVDALRMRDEFACGDDLARKDLGEEDIENLLIQQIEFCDMILLNKVSEVSPEDLARVKRIIRVLQPKAEIIECDYGRVDLDRLIETGKFNFERVATSAGWISQIERPLDELEEENAHEEDHHHHDEEHHHEEHHHHHHHHDEGEAEEYGISTFVYYRRPAFNIHRFDRFVATNWPKGVIRAKGICYFSHNRDMSFLFEQAGSQKQLSNAGLWYAAAPKEELEAMMRQEPGLRRDWDERYGDRMQKIVFIGQHLDKEQLTRDLDACLETVR
ncbi:MAG TPA: GTP-binding protein [Candidatus Parabacteroides intestinipullorum]|uniref:GTP-binding protein n=1 Tax=Candidatus Parabacteroides intestinipullorum TaxID=2838723 RepID=A0A9D1X9I6_9BACT|nr:GTP-binding protein [Candidatus Parabacteroides intestinipullorum]